MGTYTYLTESSPKTIKGEALGYLTGILYLAPSNLSGKNVCPDATPGCIAACLNTAGRAGIIKKGETTNAIQTARIRRTKAFFANRGAFVDALTSDILKLVARAKRFNLTPAVRLNGTSDLRWESLAPTLFTDFPEVQFYDYTKDFQRAMASRLGGNWPKNYHLTFSWSELCAAFAMRFALDRFLAMGGNVAIPYRGNMNRLPETTGLAQWRYVCDGDSHDLTFLRGSGRIIALSAKGRAKHDRTGFVVDC